LIAFFLSGVDDGEEVNDLIDDNPIEEDSDNESDRSRKRKKSDDEDDEYSDDRLEDDDYDLLAENLGVKIQKVVNFCCLYIIDKLSMIIFYSLETKTNYSRQGFRR